jgi:hypothetical protein
MIETVLWAKKTAQSYAQFMLHSSELMPKGSPTFPTEASIEALYEDLEVLFEAISPQCVGLTLQEFLEHYEQKASI